MRHSVLPRTLQIAEPSNKVNWSSGAVSLLTENAPWPEADRPWRAGVSSFGISGTNAHVIIEQALEDVLMEQAPEDVLAASEPGTDLVPWVLSAKTPAALREQAARLAGFAAGHPELGLRDLGHALVVGRSAFAHRAVVWGRDRDEMLGGLGDLSLPDTPGTTVGAGGVVLVFGGQGSQWLGMGQIGRASCRERVSPYV